MTICLTASPRRVSNCPPEITLTGTRNELTYKYLLLIQLTCFWQKKRWIGAKFWLGGQVVTVLWLVESSKSLNFEYWRQESEFTLKIILGPIFSDVFFWRKISNEKASQSEICQFYHEWQIGCFLEPRGFTTIFHWKVIISYWPPDSSKRLDYRTIKMKNLQIQILQIAKTKILLKVFPP